MMQTWGGTCIPSPSDQTESGRQILREHPDSPGSLGIAISEAVEAAVTDTSGQTRYALGSVLNHVMLHQTVIGLEVQKQLAMFGEKNPDVVIACVGAVPTLPALPFLLSRKKSKVRISISFQSSPQAVPALQEASICMIWVTLPA